jgi:FAD/FMN-containing dehydrogenase
VNMIDALRTIVGEAGVLDAADIAKRSAGVLRPDTLKARALVRPKDTDEVSRVVRWCHDNGMRIVTQGGLTGLVHGADASPDEVILSMERMRAIEVIDPVQLRRFHHDIRIRFSVHTGSQPHAA